MGGHLNPGDHVDTPAPDPASHIDEAATETEAAEATTEEVVEETVEEVVEETVETESDDGRDEEEAEGA